MLPEFDLLIPDSIEDACRMKKDGAMVLAGGTDVIIGMHGGKLHPAALVDIKGLKELQGFVFSDSGLDIGALTLHHDMEISEIAKRDYTALFTGCSSVGSLQTRERGTIGGNICNAVPSADSIGPLLVFDADCVVAGSAGERTIPLKDFFTGPKRTALSGDEILKRIVLPHPAKISGSAYTKYGRRKAMDLALLGVSCYLELDGSTIVTARVSLTTAAPTPMRAVETEKMLTGSKVSEELAAEAGKTASAEAKPRTSWRASEELRRTLVEELAKRTILQAAARAEAKE